MKDSSKVILILILFIGVGGYLALTTPSIDIDDFSVEKYKVTTKYESGKTEKDYYIRYGFNVMDCNAIGDVSGEINLYDKKGNLICQEYLNDYLGSKSWYEYELNVDKTIYKKIDSAELVLHNSDGAGVLYSTTTYDIVKGENTKDYVDDVVDYTPKSTASSSSSSSSYDLDSSSYETNNEVYGDYMGNSNTHKFHTSSCSWADNIKSGNMVSFSSRQDAIDSGYSPCGHCNP